MRASVAHLEIVRAGVADVAEVQRLLSEAYEPYRPVLQGSFDLCMEMILDIEPRLAAAEVLMLRVDGTTAGTVTFYGNAQDEGWGAPSGAAGIRGMGVNPRRQGLGVGTALVQECIRRARAGGATSIELHTAEWLQPAIRLYERHGFVRDPFRDVRASAVHRLAQPSDDYIGLAYRLELLRCA